MIRESEKLFNKAVGEKIKSRRKELFLTQTQVAEKLGVTFQQVQKYEKGTNGCSAKRIDELSKALRISILYFYANINLEVKNDQSTSR
jgi:transcriptional regulator with XRE-family HTH domain